MTEAPSDWEPLLVEQLASWTGFAALADRLPWDVYPPYLYLVSFITLDYGVSNTYTHVFTAQQHGVLRNPFGLAIPVGLLLCAVGIRYMRRGHENAVRDLRFEERVEDSDHHRQVFSLRTKLAVYLAVLAIQYAYTGLVVGFDEVLATQGQVHGTLVNFFITPLGYMPFAVEAVLLYLSVHVLLPRRLEDADLGVFFFDPRNMGGFEPVGNLLKYTYYLYTAGLLLFLVFMYGPVVAPFAIEQPMTPGVTMAAFFTVLWLVGIATLAYSMLKVHRIMTDEKEQRLREIEDRLRETVDNPYDITSAEIRDEGEFEDIQRRLEQIRSTSEYPTTFTMWVQISISVLLPQVLQFVVRSTL